MIFLNQEKIPIIVEIGVNHEGNLDSALKMMDLASKAGAKIVKFQSYTPSRYTSADNSERLQRVEKFAFNLEHFASLKKEAENIGLQMLSTPLTEDWVKKLSPLCPAFKIASGDITFKPVIEKAAATGKELIISTGTGTIEEIDQAVLWVKNIVGEHQLKERLILMHCVSAYPTPIEQANIRSIPFLKERYGLRVGYSNHVIGSSACLAAIALGADIIEIHFTDQKEDREFRDHALSFDQNDLRTFIKIANDVKNSLGVYIKEPQPCEIESIPLLRKGLIATRDLKKGEILTEEDITYARPATEFSSNELNQLIGKVLKEDVNQGYLIKREVI